nr:hypothetical protein [Treponema sp.]
YYDISPEMMKRGLGTWSILKEIDMCAKKGIDYYYLGYWIKGHKAMDYKANFKPFEILKDDKWIPYTDYLDEENEKESSNENI